MAKKVVAIIQARLGSSRLPLKSLLSLKGSPLIDWVADRVGQSSRIDDLLVAIPDTALDKALAEHLSSRHIPWLAGPENDVLERFAQACEHSGADLVVRVCADNPLVWSGAIDRLVDFFQSSRLDYAYNHIPRGNLWPDGLGAEIISRNLLMRMRQEARTAAQREHCMNYIWDNADKFAIGTFDPEEDWLKRPDLKLDIDSADDFLHLALSPIHKSMDAREIIEACGS